MTPDPSSRQPRAPSVEAADGHGPPSVYSLLKDAAAGWMRHNDMGLSAALSFYAILALAPLLVITIKVAGVLWRGKESAREDNTRQMTSPTGPPEAEAAGAKKENRGPPRAGRFWASSGAAVSGVSTASTDT